MPEKMTTELLELLPAQYHADTQLRDFLLAFERVLLSDGQGDGLEEKISQLATQLDPYRAPLDHLPWLASWMGLTIDADYPADKQPLYRQFVGQTVPRYRQRGTKAGMLELLEDFTGKIAQIWSTAKPHSFVVMLSLDHLRVKGDLNELERLNRVANALIQREKPAHTCYELRPKFTTFQVADLIEKHEKHGTIERKWKTPNLEKKIANPAQVGLRNNGKIEPGNMMLGQAPTAITSKGETGG
ncbi:phage tail protein [Undibacterium sp. Ji50W]|uniref:phage tail protein n=1 Tax=Undibacterium sp. Ji50W TaxID=3413041 RepID=UPI003BF1654A